MIRKILAALLLAFASPALAVPQGITPPITAADSLTVGGAALSSLVMPRWTIISKRAQFGGFSNNGGYGIPGLRTGFTSRMLEQIPPGGGVSALRLVYSAYAYGPSIAPIGAGAGGEIPGINPVTCTATIEMTTARLSNWSTPNGSQLLSPPVTFNGSQSFILPTTGIIVSDPINVVLPGGASYYVRTYCSEPIAGKIPVRVYAAGNYDGTNIGYTNATFGTGNGALTTFNYTAPVAFQPIVPGSISFSVPGFAIVTDNGVGGCPAGSGVSSCTINYAAGTVQIVTSAAVGNGATISGWFIGGAASGDQTQSVALTNFSTNQNLYINPMIGPVAIIGKPIYGAPIKAVAVFGDSINEGAGNTAGQTDTGWLDYSARAGAFGVYKAAASGLQLGSDSTLYGRVGRITALNGAGVDRVIHNAATNDFSSPGRSLSQVISYFLNAQPAFSGVSPRGGKDLWWVTMFPRTVSSVSNAPVVVSSGPYTAAGAAFGSGAVVSPTPLGGAFGSGIIGNGILSCTITGTGSAGPYSCDFGVPTMIGSLWSDGAYSTVVDTGAGGTSATTLTGSLVSTGTHTPSTGAVSVTFSSALAIGRTVNLYAFAFGPSARNAWNYFLYNYAVPNGLIGGVIDPNAVMEASPASTTGAGSGQWSSLSYTADGTHPSPTAHQTVLPGYLGPTGTNPSAVWTLN